MSQTKDSAAFIERLMTDKALQEKFQSEQATPEVIIGWALAEGYQLTEEDFKNAVEARFGNTGDALSEDQLNDISGGWVVPVISGILRFGAFVIGAGTGVKVVDELSK